MTFEFSCSEIPTGLSAVCTSHSSRNRPTNPADPCYALGYHFGGLNSRTTEKSPERSASLF
jgi:hypothetical protein